MNAYLGDAELTVEEFVKYKPQVPKGLLDALGLKANSVALPTEDPITLVMNAAKGLIDTLPYTYDLESIEVGTESARDGAQPMSQFVLQFLDHRGVSSLESKHACIAAVNAIYKNCMDPGLVIASDIAHYANDENTAASAEFTGGAGAVAVKTSYKAELLEILSIRGVSASLTYDFYKPMVQKGEDLLAKTYPTVFGKFSNVANLARVTDAYENLKEKIDGVRLDDFSGIVLHCPYPSITKYNIAAMLLSDLKDRNADAVMDYYYFMSLCELADEAFTDLDLESISDYEKEIKGILKFYMKTEEFSIIYDKLKPSLEFIQYTGNLYTGSSPLCMMSLLENSNFKSGSYILWGGYGSGNQAMFMIARTTDKTNRIAASWNTKQDKIDSRRRIDVASFIELKRIGCTAYCCFERGKELIGADILQYLRPKEGLFFINDVDNFAIKDYQISDYKIPTHKGIQTAEIFKEEVVSSV